MPARMALARESDLRSATQEMIGILLVREPALQQAVIGYGLNLPLSSLAASALEAYVLPGINESVTCSPLDCFHLTRSICVLILRHFSPVHSRQTKKATHVRKALMWVSSQQEHCALQTIPFPSPPTQWTWITTCNTNRESNNFTSILVLWTVFPMSGNTKQTQRNWALTLLWAYLSNPLNTYKD